MPTPTGTLTWCPAAQRRDLLAAPVAAALPLVPSAQVAAIDPEMADTAAFCATYDVAADASANCVVVAGRRGGVTTYAAILVLATHRADINGVVRRHLDVRKISFAPMSEAVLLTDMAYGGITPVGLPDGWPILCDSAVAQAGPIVIGSGRRDSKLLVEAGDIAALATVLPLATAVG
jgi:prolyl-tRNA editing enzyme YbaK/EbsC (Cys-tRNA(Pro) deacylase)